jgi:hypothetical protein
METKKSPKNSPGFFCKICDYYTCKKSDYDKHISTRKHEHKVSVETMEIKRKRNANTCHKCKKQYNTRSGLWKHLKVCSAISNSHDLSSENCENIEININSVNKDDLLLKLIKDNDEMMKTI